MIDTRKRYDERSNELNARFILGKKGENNLVVVGINPSDATIDKLDHTSKRVEKYSEIHGYGGWILINLYPQVNKDVDKLDKKGNDEIIKLN